MYYNIQLGDEKMTNNNDMFRKFLEDTNLIEKINKELSAKIFLDSYEGSYNGYLDKIGLNDATKYVCITRNIIIYNNDIIFEFFKESTYGSDEGFNIMNYNIGNLIKEKTITIDDKLFEYEEIKASLYKSIAKKYVITDDVINDYYSPDREKSSSVKSFLYVVNLYDKIEKKENMINSLNNSITLIKEEINKIQNENIIQDTKQKTI